MNRILIPIVIIVLIGCGADVEQKSISLETDFDTTTATIGDIIHYSIHIDGLGDKFVIINEFEKPEALELRKSEISKIDDGYLSGFQFVFWDTGRFTIPSIDIIIMNVDSSVKLVMQTDPQHIIIVSSADPTMSGAMKPMKDPLPVSKPINLVIIVCLSLLIISIIGIVLLSIKYKKETLIGVPDVILPSPDEVAMEKINTIKANNEIQSDVKELYVQISYILREYVESSLFFKTLEMTTNEIQELQKLFPFSEQEMEAWITLLNRSDMIKYAKMIPESKAWLEDLSIAEKFIKSTTPYWKQVESPNA
ncbi:MAG: hypothetical protein IIB95_00325 [Candidatus Marinimicrobia bacterium]|nr:hypothetical protein [Candidatus Neomarinimicrobiota bacterium]MCH7762168.1 hypothetical protein [Candidatus Neomarinimicrobiota bacterium]